MTDATVLQSMIEAYGVELYDTEIVSEYGEPIFRVYITSSKGILLDDCAEVTKLISPYLDVNPPMSGKYRLEVSSPGLERKLKSEHHFQKSTLQNVKISLIDNSVIKGKLLSFNDGDIVVDDEKQGEITINFSDIHKARTYIDW